MRADLTLFRVISSYTVRLAAIGILAAAARPSVAQITQRIPQGLNPIVPKLQPLDPRSTETANEPLRTTHRPPNDGPVSSFVDSLTRSDSAIEVIVGQARILTTKAPIASENGVATVATGDPTIIDFDIMPNPQMIRILGRRVGVTDLSVSTSDGNTYSFEIHVVYDIKLLNVYLRQIFPEAQLKVAQMREHVVVEGQARSPEQVTQIIQTIQAYLQSAQVPHKVSSNESPEEGGRRPIPRGEPADGGENGGSGDAPPDQAGPDTDKPDTEAEFAPPQIINLIRVPSIQQVMLKVRIAELDRSALREIGSDLFFQNGAGTTVGTQIAGAFTSLLGSAPTQNTTVFGVFPGANFEIMLRALRRNAILNILAEPNLTALSGHQADFLAGGEFPVPVPQTGGGLSNIITIEYKAFGVQLNFVPYVLDDEAIRLSVSPEVSTIDESLGVQLQGFLIPGLNTRRANTTVEMKQGQTLVLAGLLQLDLAAQTSRIPVMGDLPYIGPFFSNTSHERVEKELLVLVTPYLISPVREDQLGRIPGEEINDPNDLEFYFLNRIEGRLGRPHRPTTNWDDPWNLVQRVRLESQYIHGPVGFSGTVCKDCPSE